MSNFQKVASWMQAIVASAALIFNDRFQSLFKTIGLARFYLVALILVTIVGMKLADEGGDYMIEHCRWLRRLLSGQDDIEGDWVNIAFGVEAPDQIKFVEFCRIWYREGHYIISGDSWTIEGAWVQEFSSANSTYKNRELTYTYRTGLNSVGGYGTIRFFPYDSLSSDFICRYQDDNSKTRHITRGRRLTASSRSLTIDERRDIALKFARDFKDKKLLAVSDAMPQFE